MNITRIRIALLIVAAAILTYVIYKLPIAKTDVAKSQSVDKVVDEHSQFDWKVYIDSITSLLPPEQQSKVQSFTTTETSGDTIVYSKLANMWDANAMPGIAAFYREKIAEKFASERQLLEAAYRYFDGYKQATAESERSAMVHAAIKNYEKVMAINPANLNAKTDLGVLYAEGTDNPMKGIMMLREVVQTNPEHENAQMNLGLLSMKSNQNDKALERFDKVLAINPDRLETFIYKAYAYVALADTNNAVMMLQNYLRASKDGAMKAEVEDMIKNLER